MCAPLRAPAASDGKRLDNRDVAPYIRGFVMNVREIRGRIVLLSFAVGLASCRSPEAWRREADERAGRLIAGQRTAAVGESGPVAIERPSETFRRRLIELQGLPSPAWPTPAAASIDTGAVVRLTLEDALRIGAHNSREYQDAKEDVFRAALALDLRQDEYRHSFAALVSGTYSERRGGEAPVRGIETAGTLTAQQRLAAGGSVVARLAVDLVKLLTLDRDSAYGLLADATVTIPLLRGAGRDIAQEPMRQAERNLTYALCDFERTRRAFAARVVGDYLGALQQQRAARNAEENERRIAQATARAQRLAEAGRLPEIQVDQARQDLLRARERTIAARSAAEQRLDRFKIALGISSDARIALDEAELDRLMASDAARVPVAGFSFADGEGTIPAPPVEPWVRMALRDRLDLRVALGRVEDARRAARSAADALRTGLSLELSGSAGERRSLGSAASGDATLDFGKGNYAAKLGWEWPWRRTAERNAWRESLIALERAQRRAEETEDQVKAQVRDAARGLTQAHQTLEIQRQAVAVAQRRIQSVDLFLQAGRAQIRDLLEAQEALVSAQNALAAAVVGRRVAELTLLRELERLRVDDDGQWREADDAVEF